MTNRISTTVLIAAAVAASGLLAAAAVSPPAAPPVAQAAQAGGGSTEEQRKAIGVAQEFARAVAKADSPEYFRVLEQSLLTLRLKEYPPAPVPAGRVLAAPEGARPGFAALREKIRGEAADLSSLRADPTWQANFKKWFNRIGTAQDSPLRIIGGVPASEGEFPDCVAVGSSAGFCCSGTLVGPQLVVTAAHCVRGGCADRIFVGVNSNDPATGRVVKVRKAVAHPDFNPFTLGGDIAVLVLEEPVPGVTPRKIASGAEIDAAFFVQLVGFGITEFAAFGIQFKVEAVIASSSCDSAGAQQKFGCNAGTEIVAGGNGVDSCNGDSGGPAYVAVDGEFRLAGATSRATRNSARPCGDGGIYTRVDRYVDWIKATAAAEGVGLE